MLAVAHHQHVGRLGDLCVVDLLADGLGAIVDAAAHSRGRKAIGDARRVVVVAVGDGQDRRLHGGEPGGEAPGVVLDEDPHEALHRPQERAVDHHRPVLGVVLALVGEVETLGHLEVDLAGAALPRAPERVGDVKVDLRPVERPLPRTHLVVAALPLERLAQRLLGTVPLLLRADVLVGPRR